LISAEAARSIAGAVLVAPDADPATPCDGSFVLRAPSAQAVSTSAPSSAKHIFLRLIPTQYQCSSNGDADEQIVAIFFLEQAVPLLWIDQLNVPSLVFDTAEVTVSQR